MSEVLELRNDSVSVEIVPTEGARLRSLRCLRSGVEFLVESPGISTGMIPEPGRNVRFTQGATAGMDECLPTVTPCFVGGQMIPDHGDFWQLPWTVMRSSEEGAVDEARLVADGFSLPLRFEKTVRLHGAEVHLESCLTNIGDSDAAFLYAAHPLLAVSQGDRILLPPECIELTLYDSRDERLGRMGALIPWPMMHSSDGAEVQLDRIDALQVGSAEMLYTRRMKQGWCGLYRGLHRQGITIRFGTDELPYMGLWICAGGWPEDAGTAVQYAFAPEPTTAPCGSLREAVEQGMAVTLKPGACFRFSVQLCISKPEIDMDSFKVFASSCMDTAPVEQEKLA
jgi:hypothetical protein